MDRDKYAREPDRPVSATITSQLSWRKTRSCIKEANRLTWSTISLGMGKNKRRFEYMSIESMPADIFTKSLAKNKLPMNELIKFDEPKIRVIKSD